MEKKIVIAGGTGFIGSYLTQQFTQLGYRILIISRQKGHIHWDEQAEIAKALENAELLINLAGKSVDCRYNEKNKQAILSSRTETTKKMGTALLDCKNPPALWINASTATIYRHAEDRPMTEKDGEVGDNFSVNVGLQWEEAFFSFDLPKTRQVALRIAIVLGKNGGVMQPYMNLVRFGLGGKQGNGRQMFSWIHIEDVFNIVRFLQANKDLEGIVNCSAPNPVKNTKLMQTFRDVMHVKLGLPSPKWMLEMGAVLVRTETELILKSRWVVPEKLVNAGYDFKYTTLQPALENIINGMDDEE